MQAGPALSGPFALGEKLGGADLGRPDFEILGGLVIILRQQSPPTVRLPRHGLRYLGRFIAERDPLPRVGLRVSNPASSSGESSANLILGERAGDANRSRSALTAERLAGWRSRPADAHFNALRRDRLWKRSGRRGRLRLLSN